MLMNNLSNRSCPEWIILLLLYACFSSTRMVMCTLRHTVATTSAGEGIKPFSLLGQGHSLCSYVSKLQYDTCCEADQTSGSNKGGQRSQRPRWTPAVRTINQPATAATNSQAILHLCCTLWRWLNQGLSIGIDKQTRNYYQDTQTRNPLSNSWSWTSWPMHIWSRRHRPAGDLPSSQTLSLCCTLWRWLNQGLSIGIDKQTRNYYQDTQTRNPLSNSWSWTSWPMHIWSRRHRPAGDLPSSQTLSLHPAN